MDSPTIIRVLLINQLFQPEPNYLRGLDFVKSVQGGEFSVEVLTGFPNYPDGEIYDGYKNRPYYSETFDDVKVHRVGHYISHDSSGLKRILSYATLMVSVFMFLVVRGGKYDVLWVQQGPATLGIAAGLAKKLRKRQKYVLDAQDLWPDSVTNSGMLSPKVPVGLLTKLSKFAATTADHIVTLSPGAANRLAEIGASPEQISVVSNWGIEAEVSDSAKRSAFGLMSQAGGGFTAVYVGAFGHFQDLKTVVKAAEILREETDSIRLILAGDGAEHDEVVQLASELGVDSVTFAGRLEPLVATALIQMSDVLLLHLRESPLSMTAIPSKFATYLRGGRPTIVAAEGAVAQLAEEAGAGPVVESGSPQQLAKAIMFVYQASRSEREQLGTAAKSFYASEMSQDAGIEKLRRVLVEVSGSMKRQRTPGTGLRSRTNMRELESEVNSV